MEVGGFVSLTDEICINIFYRLYHTISVTLPETNSSHLNMDGMLPSGFCCVGVFRFHSFSGVYHAEAKMPFAEGTAPNCCGFCFCCRSKEFPGPNPEIR